MATNTLTLFCLIEGDSTSYAFKVRILDTHTDVSDLKKAIVGEKPNAFEHVDPNDLVLWKVSIPIIDNDETPILLDNARCGDKKKLGPATRLSKVFPPEELAEETVHIVVERPKGMLCLAG
jgi:hypothetical protein